MAKAPPVVLTIAGFDPSSGAGVTADIKTIAAHGCYGVACVTAMTVQSTLGVRRVQVLKPELVSNTLSCLAEDFEIAAVHVGMLGSATVGEEIAQFLETRGLPNVVLDPIIKSSSGMDLIDAQGVGILAGRLLNLAAVITPNVDEAAVLTGLTINNQEQMKVAVVKLHEMGAKAVVITGGHLDKAVDVLSFKDKYGVHREVFKSEKLRSTSTHGTGCAFSSAIACHLAHGRSLPEAVLLAKAYVFAAIGNAAPTGKGVGSINHLFRMGEQRRVNIQHHPEPVAH
jgi:hydroxymethylpyrimidine/phosphomethylpyrimidine kinase